MRVLRLVGRQSHGRPDSGTASPSSRKCSTGSGRIWRLRSKLGRCSFGPRFGVLGLQFLVPVLVEFKVWGLNWYMVYEYLVDEDLREGPVVLNLQPDWIHT